MRPTLALVAAVALASQACAPRAAQHTAVTAAETSRSSGNSQGSTTTAANGPTSARVMDSALATIRDGARRGDATVLRSMSIELGRGGATEINGDRAEDERVSTAEIAVFDAQTALLIVKTSCGNVQLVGLVRDGAAWGVRQSQALVPPVRPGSCVRSTVLAQPVALRSDPAREAAIGLRWEDAMGDEVHGPHLWIAGLDAQRGFVLLLERAPFGGTDDRTGSTTVGSVAVIDELPAPRPLFVEIRPGTRGPAGAGPSQRTVRRYELRGARMELVDEQRSTLGDGSEP